MPYVMKANVHTQKTWRLFLNVHYCATDAAVKTKKLYRVATLIMYAFIC